ncbi:MAG: DNA-directed RNA polymerase subunit alpha [Candidatus Eiseniibacteriota bacterium]|jgi:DNA-directed RNA polymerase subunit alpha
MKVKPLQMPRRVEYEEKTLTNRFGRFFIEPLERGFGHTIGNALRRVLLSSLPGGAVTAVKIHDALHEFTALPGVYEDTTQIILNLKQIRFKFDADGPVRGHFEKRGKGELVASDMEVDPSVTIINPDLHIATLNDEAELVVDCEISAGRGYVVAEQHPNVERPIGVISIDSQFSPVERVNMHVENTRIKQHTDYDKLTLEVWTDGSVAPMDAMSQAAKVLKEHFELFSSFEEETIEPEVKEEDEERSRIRALLQKSVEELELSVRSSNCLRAAEIATLAELVQKSEAEMLKYRNFGRKSLKEIADVLQDMGLSFGMDVKKYLEPQTEEETEEEYIGL